MFARKACGIAVVVWGLALCPATQAAGQPIASVEVNSQVSRAGQDLKALVRGKVESQLQGVNWGDTRNGGPYVLSTSLMRLDTSTQGGAVTVVCTVSMSLRDQKKGILRAIVQGRARAEDRAEAVRQAEEDAVRVAVRSAVSGLPEAIRRSR